MELISRETVLNTIRNLEGELAGEGKPTPMWTEVTNWLYISFAKLPIENRPKGKWIKIKSLTRVAYSCSICSALKEHKHNYCEECGADMRDEEIGNNHVFLIGKGETKPKPYYIIGEYVCDRNKCHENEINDVPCKECECCADTRGEE